MGRRRKEIVKVEVRPIIERSNLAIELSAGAFPIYQLGNDIDCDTIIPVRFCVKPTQENLRTNCLRVLDPDFTYIAEDGIIIVAGEDFGRGSANENAVRSLQLAGVFAIIAVSFSSVFYRNAINLGLPIAVLMDPKTKFKAKDRIKFDVKNWSLTRNNDKSNIPISQISKLEQDILLAGSLIKLLKENPNYA